MMLVNYLKCFILVFIIPISAFAEDWVYAGFQGWQHPNGKSHQVYYGKQVIGDDEILLLRDMNNKRWFLEFKYNSSFSLTPGVSFFYRRTRHEAGNSHYSSDYVFDGRPIAYQIGTGHPQYLVAEISSRDIDALVKYDGLDIGIQYPAYSPGQKLGRYGYTFSGDNIAGLIHEINTAINKNIPNLSLCDALAGHTGDPQVKGVGVSFSQLNGKAAVAACKTALASEPNNSRYKTNLSRAYNKLEKYDHSFQLVSEAVKAGYPLAYYLLGLYYDLGEGVVENKDKAIEYMESAGKMGVGISLVALATDALKRKENRLGYSKGSSDFTQIQHQLLQAQATGIDVDGSLAELYYLESEEMIAQDPLIRMTSFSESESFLFEALTADELEKYRSLFLLSKEHYDKYILRYSKSKKAKKNLVKINYMLANQLGKKDIEARAKKDKLDAYKKKVFARELKLPESLIFKSQINDVQNFRVQRSHWYKQLPSIGHPYSDVAGTFFMSGKKATLGGTGLQGDKRYRTAQQSFDYVDQYTNRYDFVVVGKSRPQVATFIKGLKKAALDSNTKSHMFVLGLICRYPCQIYPKVRNAR